LIRILVLEGTSFFYLVDFILGTVLCLKAPAVGSSHVYLLCECNWPEIVSLLRQFLLCILQVLQCIALITIGEVLRFRYIEYFPARYRSHS
jgi:hypothetical protein